MYTCTLVHLYTCTLVRTFWSNICEQDRYLLVTIELPDYVYRDLYMCTEISICVQRSLYVYRDLYMCTEISICVHRAP